MSLFKRLFGDVEAKTFEQDLELLIFRWTDRMSMDDIGNRLLDRAEQALDRPKPPPRKRPK